MKSKLDLWLAASMKIPIAGLSRKAIEQWQLQHLNHLLPWARQHSSYYQYLPERLECLADIARLPLMDTGQLSEHGQQMLCVSQSEISRVVTAQTSGTMGDAKRLFFTPEDHQSTVRFFACGISELVQPGDRMLILMPSSREGSIGTLIEQALTALDAVAVPCGPQETFAVMAKKIVQHQVNTIVGSPVQLLSLARYMQQENIDCQIKAVLVSSDYLPEMVRTQLEQELQCTVFDHYGITESGYAFSIECSVHQGLHIRENDLLVEIIEPQTGLTVPDGQWGELVFTTLTRTAMPLIRYRTGDRARLLAEPCPCGSIVKRMDKIRGRIEQLEQPYPITLLDEQLFAIKPLVDYRAVYLAEKKILQVTLRLRPDSEQLGKIQVEQQLKALLHPGDSLQLILQQWQRQQVSSLYHGKRQVKVE